MHPKMDQEAALVCPSSQFWVAVRIQILNVCRVLYNHIHLTFQSLAFRAKQRGKVRTCFDVMGEEIKTTHHSMFCLCPSAFPWSWTLKGFVNTITDTLKLDSMLSQPSVEWIFLDVFGPVLSFGTNVGKDWQKNYAFPVRILAQHPMGYWSFT